MVCKDCRNVETVDVGVGDGMIIVEMIDRGIGDGIVHSEWFNKRISAEKDDSVKSESKQKVSVKKRNLRKRAKIKSSNTNEQNAAELKITLHSNKHGTYQVESISNRTRIKQSVTSLKVQKSIIGTGSKRKLRSSRSASKTKPAEEDTSCDSEREMKVSSEREEGEKNEVPEPKKKRIQIFVKEKCKICGRLFRKHYMQSHMRSHNKEKPHCCEKCGKKFADLNYFKYHLRQCVENPSAFQCDICQRNMASKRSLEEHVKTHSTECSFQCHVCAKVFKQGANLANHLKIHNEQTPFVCDICGKGYRVKRSMERHRLRFHEGIRESFQCEMCEKKFACKLNLRAHLDKHLGITRYKCELCEKRFSTKQVLKIHMRIHEGKKPFACKECGRLFRQLTVLKRHMTTHSGIKPFRCEACGKQFIHRVYLQRHKCPQTVLSNNEEKNHEGSNNILECKSQGNNNLDNAAHHEYYETAALGNAYPLCLVP